MRLDSSHQPLSHLEIKITQSWVDSDDKCSSIERIKKDTKMSWVERNEGNEETGIFPYEQR